jgi:eukaryotic-like serine/threonine-protein kinase
MTDWATGVQLGPYTLVSPLGVGGMGEVWKARDTRLNRIVAIKRLAAPYTDRFDQEARAIAALNHPHICQIHDVGHGYLILEYVEGKRLQGPLPTDQALRLAIQIAGALEHAHSCGILHRDLKPANVMVTSPGEAKLLDFGLAKLVNRDADVTQTLEGAVVGTAAYMSPEQAEGKTLDSRSDIFSFGAMLYEMLSGVRAFGGTTTLSVLNAVLRDTPSPLQATPGLERIVRQCLAKLPASRFQTMGEVRAALEQASRELVLPPASTQPSIAVLPFADMSPGRDHEWFGDGVAEEIINALTRVPGLVVIARTSAFAFKGKNEDIRRIAGTLGVAHVLEGSVRRAGSRVRVTAQLITAANGSHLWSERFDREMADVFAVQDEIASAIAATLQVKLTGAPGTHRRYTPALPAYEAFLKALHHAQKLTPDAMTRSREHFEQAIALDPGFALAHSMYGFYFAQLANYGLMPAHEAMPLVRAKARRALEIDSSLPDPHAMLGVVAGLYDYDWVEAERQFRLAMATDPISAQIRRAYALYYLLPTSRFREAADECERALKEDPVDLMGRLRLAQCFRAAGRIAEGLRTLQDVLELDENLWFTHFILGLEHAQSGNLSQAMVHAERAYVLAPWSPSAIGAFAAILTRSGEAQRAEALLDKLRPGDAYGAPIGLGTFHLVCSEIEPAVEWVKKTIAQRHPAVFFFLNVHGQALRSSPSWPQLADSLNLRDRLGV